MDWSASAQLCGWQQQGEVPAAEEVEQAGACPERGVAASAELSNKLALALLLALVLPRVNPATSILIEPSSVARVSIAALAVGAMPPSRRSTTSSPSIPPRPSRS